MTMTLQCRLYVSLVVHLVLWVFSWMELALRRFIQILRRNWFVLPALAQCNQLLLQTLRVESFTLHPVLEQLTLLT